MFYRFLLAALLVTASSIWHCASGLRCYECMDCKELSAKNRTKECEGTDPVCFKTTIKVPQGSFGVVHARGCMQRSNQQLNCTTSTGSAIGTGTQTTRCLCNRSLCNGCTHPTHTAFLWLSLSVVLLLNCFSRIVLGSTSYLAIYQFARLLHE